VYGDGRQSRCFAHVEDTVRALLVLLESDKAVGRAFNIGSSTEVTIRELAERVVARAGSSSRIRHVPYEEAYEEGFDELGRRKPDTALLRELTGWAARRTVDDAIDDVIEHERIEVFADADEGLQVAN
ncbi:MAG: GDP-mannose 4,6-dehydratase, partial [Actinomycetota bacterium]|nr:GDP-mannose 4,6-dehydratase [Actinomycetota bacterium]